jgi:biopolymer transport protein ExbD
MGGVDVGSEGGGKKATNAEINMVPFIDLLMCTIAFLLITAVWVTNSRMNADAQVPGPPNPDKELTPQTPEKVLNLHIGETDFALIWKQGATVVSEIRVPKNSNPESTRSSCSVSRPWCSCRSATSIRREPRSGRG